MDEIITEDGEIVSASALTALDSGFAAEMAKAEISQQVATARQYPRSIKKAVASITTLATLDEIAAQECIYALPRGGKPIRGPSIRLAEITQQQWGNNRVAARVIEVDRAEKVVVAEAIFHDLETNAATKATVRRRIVDSKGRLYNDDMIVMTGNAACSIARRNAIFAGVPKAIWRQAHEAAEKVIKGDVQTLSERRDRAIKSFATWGVKPEQVFAAIGVAGEEEVTLEHLPTLFGMFQSIKNGEATVEEMFDPRRQAGGAPKAFNPLKDEADKGEPEKKPAQKAKQEPQDQKDDATGRASGEAEPADGDGGVSASSPVDQDPAAPAEVDDSPRGQLLAKLRKKAGTGARALKLALAGLPADEAALLTEDDTKALQDLADKSGSVSR